MTGFGRASMIRVLTIASRLLPSRLSPWSRAMACELAAIPTDGAALAFTIGCLRATFQLAIIAWLRSTWAAVRDILFLSITSTWSPTMNGIAARPRLLGLICGTGAVAAGIAYMLAAGAPSAYLAMNLVALVLGAAAWLMLGRTTDARLVGAGPIVLALAVALLLTALFGVSVDGTARWMSVGPVNVQISLVVLPVMIVLYARQPDTIGTIGLIGAALALAIQPDRAMAGVLLASLVCVSLAAPSRSALAATTAAGLAFGWTMLKPDRQPAVPYVDRILYTAFDVHPLAGVAVVFGAAALVVPAVVGMMRNVGPRSTLLAFGACWMGIVIAAALGNYPTPLVGYGGSAVLGYLLSVALLPDGAGARRRSGASRSPSTADPNADRMISEVRGATFAHV